MFKKIKNRQNATGIIILFYLSTVVFLTAMATKFAPPSKSWSLLANGLLLSVVGSGATLWILRLWENHLRVLLEEKSRIVIAEIPQFLQGEEKTIEKTVEDSTSLLETIIREKEILIHEIQENLKRSSDTLIEKEENIKQLRLEFDRQKEEIRTLTQQYTQYKEDAENRIKQQSILCEEYQQTMTDQRLVIKKKQKDLQQYESKIRDLNYEIKTLLELNDSFKKQPGKIEPISTPHQGEMMLKDTIYTYQVMEEPVPNVTPEEQNSVNQELIHSSPEATKLLKRCVNIAQKITGAHQFSGNISRFKEIGMENFALDRRRLFENLRSETSSCVFIFSPKDNKPLFVNNQIRDLLGWSADTFIDHFHEILQEGIQEWKRAVAKLNVEYETDIRLVMKNKQGQDILIHCLLGYIPTGLFKGHLVGILYQD